MLLRIALFTVPVPMSAGVARHERARTVMRPLFRIENEVAAHGIVHFAVDNNTKAPDCSEAKVW